MRNLDEYLKLRSRMQTGDLILFRDGPPLSWVLQCTHVGMVVRFPETDWIALWESVARGVVLVGLSDKLADYNGMAWWRQLAPASDTATAKWPDAYRKYHGRPYERNPLEFLGAAGRWLRVTWPWSKGSLFCSELVAATYQDMGIIGKRWPADEYSPDDFWYNRIDWTEPFTLLRPERIV